MKNPEKIIADFRLLERWVSVKDLVEFLNGIGVRINRESLRRRASEGTIPGFQILGEWKFSPDAVANWLERERRLPLLRPMNPEEAVKLREALGCGNGVLTLRVRMVDVVTGKLETGTIPNVATKEIPEEFLLKEPKEPEYVQVRGEGWQTAEQADLSNVEEL